MNALDARGVTPLHLANSRLRLARESDDRGGECLSRKKEIYGIVEMLREYLAASRGIFGDDGDNEGGGGGDQETRELEELASKLSLSETPEQVGEGEGYHFWSSLGGQVGGVKFICTHYTGE